MSFDDPPDDATGTGTYSLPTSAEFRAGDFDLRRFAVYVEGDEAVLEVTLGASIRRPEISQRTNSTPVPLTNNLYLQNIDIYIDRDRGPGGHAASIPGRRVSFDGTWEVAVVMTPQPQGARAVVQGALGDAARDVFFASPLQVQGRTVAARVPLAALGGRPAPTWGYAVHVSGAQWERSFRALDLVRGTTEADAMTLPVYAVAEEWAFGGGPLGRVHPQVIDVLLPAGVAQGRLLSAFNADKGTYARLPFVVAGPRGALLSLAPRAAPTAPEEVGLVVVEASADTLSAKGPVTGVRPFQFGTVLDAAGNAIGRVVVVKVLEGGLVASIFEKKQEITPGARVRFDEPGPAPPEDHP